jgi:cell division protein FtsL
LFMALEKASAESRRLHNEQERLEIEKRAQATTLRVDRLSRERLQMRPANAAITQYVAAPPSQPAQSQPAQGVAP